MSAALLELLPEPGGPNAGLAALDAFIGNRLHAAGVWASSRDSDGISSYRVRERTETRVRVCGLIWTIDQKLHAYWLDLERDAPDGGQWRWTLYYDLDASLSERARRNAFDLLDSPDAIAWEVTLRGRMNEIGMIS